MIVEEQGGEMQVIWVNNRFVVKVMLYFICSKRVRKIVNEIFENLLFLRGTGIC